MKTIKLELVSAGRNGTINLDGQDISKYVSAVTVDARAGHHTSVTLDLAPLLVNLKADEVKVTLPTELEDLLERLGWTPPGSCAQGCR